MGVAGWVWAVTLVALTAVLIADLLIIGRRPHEPSFRESTLWVTFYVGLAVLFGLGIWYFSGPTYAGQFYAGWLTEYSLSVDNLFVFVIIMSRFMVPRQYQQKVLLIAALLHDPDVLVLDEPESGLDVSAALVLRHLVTTLAREGKAILYSSHVLDSVERLCTRVIVLQQGACVATGTSQELRQLMSQPTLEDVFAQLALRQDPERTARDIAQVVMSR